MKVLLAEYAVGAGIKKYMPEGRAMLSTLIKSFVSCKHEVFYPSAGARLGAGKAIITDDFQKSLYGISKICDAALVIAPDDVLGNLTEIVEENTENLGCSSDSVRLCADKLGCTRMLQRENIPVPETIGIGEYSGNFVIKPRFGCASEGVYRSNNGTLKEGLIATKFIEGEHLSASVITGKSQLPLTVNRQLIDIGERISYKGGVVPYNCERNDEIIDVAKKAAKILGCRGYAGVDIVLGDKPYVVDINPRPTTSIIGIAKVLDIEMAELILRARFGELPLHINVKGSFAFKKDELLSL